MLPFLIAIISLISIIIGYSIPFIFLRRNIARSQQKSDDLIAQAEEKTEQIVTHAEETAEKMLMRSEREHEKQLSFISQREESITKKEEKIDAKEEKIETIRSSIEQKEEDLKATRESLTERLTQISGMTQEEAYHEIQEHARVTYSSELTTFVDKVKKEKQLTAKQEAHKIIADILPKVSHEYVGEFTSVLVDLPTEETKWRIIWREWRNISHFERVCGVNLVIDDTPLIVKIASHNPQQRYIAKIVLEKLIKDGKINPVHIQNTYDQTLEEFDDLVLEKWKEAFSILNIPLLHTDIVELVGRFYFRYSYGQNLWQHSIEVANIAALIADELWYDTLLAKKAWLLHDIGKVASQTYESHTKVWWQLLRKYNVNDIIINTAEWHHGDIDITHPLWWIVTAADTLSASRPGARFDTRELFIERMQQLEELIKSEYGVQKTYIMQAWREVIVFVDPDKIPDTQIDEILRSIGEKIDEQMEYPWMIRIVWVRESTATHYIR